MRPEHARPRPEAFQRSWLQLAERARVRHVPPDCPCRDYDSTTKNSTSNFVEILRFKHFIHKIYFVPEGENYRNKVIKNHLLVRVVVDLGCGNTFFDDSLTEAEPTQNSQFSEIITV